MGAVAAALTIADPTHAETMNEAESTEKQGGAVVKPGMVFGRLRVVEEGLLKVDKDGHRRRRWECRCECGGAASITEKSLKSGNTKSCGCLKKEAAVKTGNKNATHSLSGTSEHIAWNNMRARCNNPKAHNYQAYGARGIKICERWASREPKKFSIDDF